MTTQTLTLTDFLLARIAEDERLADLCLGLSVPSSLAQVYAGPGHHPIMEAPRLKAECEAKRQIVEMLAARDEQEHPAVTAHATGLRLAVKALAAVYADHPDYREEWRA